MRKFKLIKIEPETHKALVMYCAAHGVKIKATASKWLNERLLTEAQTKNVVTEDP